MDLASALLRATRAVLLSAPSVLDDMPVAQARCLLEVSRGEGRPMRRLAQDLGIKLPALSQIVDRLVRRGLLERRTDFEDRRVVRLYLTTAAGGLIEETERAREGRLVEVLEAVEPACVARLVDDLNRLAQAGGVEPDPVAPWESPDPLAEWAGMRARRLHGRRVPDAPNR
jgi:DNA-binding MarR family transcriptional regulator